MTVITINMLKLLGKKLRVSACNISLKHEDNRKKIVGFKCYLSYCEILIQKKYFITKMSQGNDMRSLQIQWLCSSNSLFWIVIHAPALNPRQIQDFSNPEFVSRQHAKSILNLLSGWDASNQYLFILIYLPTLIIDFDLFYTRC